MRKKPVGRNKRSSRKRPSGPIRSVKRAFRRIRSKISRKRLKSHKIKNFSAENSSPINSNTYPIAPVFESDLPIQYGDNKIVLLVKDPWWLFVYWEVTAAREKEVRELIQREGLTAEKTVLRVYDVTDAPLSQPHSFFDIELNSFTTNWYIDVGVPDRQWVVELGIRARGGRFFVLIRSNLVRTPRFGVSDVLDEEWMMPEESFWKLFRLSGGFSSRNSSLELSRLLPTRKLAPKRAKKSARIVDASKSFLAKH